MSFPLNSASPAFTQELVFSQGDPFFQTLLASIRAAKNTIHFETYIFDQDVLGLEILETLAQAVQRGVRVVLSMDGIGSSSWTFVDAEKWRARGLEVHFFHPLPWQKSFRRFWRSLRLQKIRLGFSKLNQRNHRKVCIIDDRLALVGSMNVTVRHLISVSGAKAWRDTSVLIESPGAGDFLRTCNEEGRAFYYQNVMKQIHHAKEKIWITTPYFIPSRKLMRALRAASHRGIDVRLLFPRHSDFFGVKYAMEAFYRRLLRANIQVFEYLPSMLHAKVLILDNQVTIGSSNLDHRSLFHDLEANIMLQKPENIEQVKAQFLADLTQSKNVEYALWKKRSFVQRFLEKFFLCFRGVF